MNERTPPRPRQNAPRNPPDVRAARLAAQEAARALRRVAARRAAARALDFDDDPLNARAYPPTPEPSKTLRKHRRYDNNNDGGRRALAF